MKMQVKLTLVSIPGWDISFYLIYALEPPIGNGKGHIRIIRCIEDQHEYRGVTISENEMRYIWADFQDQENITESWINFALKNAAYGIEIGRAHV